MGLLRASRAGQRRRSSPAPTEKIDPTEDDEFAAEIRDRYYPGFDGPAVEGAGLSRWLYEHVRCLVRCWGSRRSSAWSAWCSEAGADREIVLIGGSSIAMLVLPAATVVLEVRYLYTVLPFLVVGAALTITALLERRAPKAEPVADPDPTDVPTRRDGRHPEA